MRTAKTVACLFALAWAAPAFADEALLGYLRGAEVLPKGTSELYTKWTSLRDKGMGSYQAYDGTLDYEYGVTDKFSAVAGLEMLSIDSKGLLIEAYVPKDRNLSLRPSGFTVAGKYNFLQPALAPIGLAARVEMGYGWIDKFSGQRKDTLWTRLDLLAQKYFLDGRVSWISNLGMEAAYAYRAAVKGIPEGFDWPVNAEMEIELLLGTGVSYRFAPNWSAGVEALYETEFETQVNQERWSFMAGPTLHYGGKKWWATFTYLPQWRGGGLKYAGQTNTRLHLIEKTKHEARLWVGLNF
ncbi:MAG TPA: DUF6662 family protein [Stenotrophomonas sp.]|nr:DUF6662 family protein [Stenotrophomonas sp.]